VPQGNKRQTVAAAAAAAAAEMIYYTGTEFNLNQGKGARGEGRVHDD